MVRVTLREAAQVLGVTHPTVIRRARRAGPRLQGSTRDGLFVEDVAILARMGRGRRTAA